MRRSGISHISKLLFMLELRIRQGFSPDDAAALGKKWRLKTGDVYDQNYGVRFFREEAREVISRIVKERQTQGKPMPNLKTQEAPNRQALIVNLTVELKD